MRNPDRIPVIISKLAEKWEAYPDLRFGQLIVNIASLLPRGEEAVYWAEEEEWLAAIEKFAVVPGKYRGEV